MQYLNGTPCIVRTRDYLRSSYAQRGVWHALWCYCHEQNNGGKIAFPDEWTAREWESIQVCPEIIKAECPLWHATGSFLFVHHYNVDAEKVFLTKVKKGREYALRRWEKLHAVKPVKHGSPNGSPIPSPNGSPKGHPIRREGSRDVLPSEPSAKQPRQATDLDARD